MSLGLSKLMYKNIREILNIIKSREGKEVDIYEILGEMQIPSNCQHIIEEDIEKLIKNGLIVEKKKNTYIPSNFSDELVGNIKLGKNGYGIVSINNNKIKELFIPPKYTNRSLDGDTVVVKIIKDAEDGKRAEGKVVQVLNRKKKIYVGTMSIQEDGKYGFVICDDARMNKDIYVAKEDINKALDGEKVVCELIKWDKDDKNPVGKIKEILGNEGDIGIDILSVAKEYGFESEFPDNVKKECRKINTKVLDEDINDRIDLRNKKIFTIDGRDAKDLDDAISIERNEDEFILGVHIADVANYVIENMKIDKEARKRGTSVYLVDRVIPMLPKVLSNGICSLNQGEDRLTLSIEMRINQKGQVVDYEIFESVINSKFRMNYDEVSNLLESIDEYDERYKLFEKELKECEKLANILMNKRRKRGAIDFNFAEAKIIVNEEGKAIDVKKEDRRIANRIIEEFMLIANETIAMHFCMLELPFVYRNHELPDIERIISLEEKLNRKGLSLGNNLENISSKKFQQICEQIEGTELEYFINKMMLMSLKEAKYMSNMIGHFGLAAQYYCHFTSPIRRYPDLQIHRIIKDSINGNMSSNVVKKYLNRVDDVAYHSSKMERAAQEAENKVELMKKCEYASTKIGEIYEGIISGTISKGFFVQLDNTIEGIVRIENLKDDMYVYKEEDYLFEGIQSKKVYSLGNKVNVKIIDVDMINNEIEFLIV